MAESERAGVALSDEFVEEPEVLEVMGRQLVARVRLRLHLLRETADSMTIDYAGRGQSIGGERVWDVLEHLDGSVKAFAHHMHIDLSTVGVPINEGARLLQR